MPVLKIHLGKIISVAEVKEASESYPVKIQDRRTDKKERKDHA